MLEPIITFEALSEWFGLMARDVREVARLRGVRTVPRAPEVIAGLAEVHGRVVTLIDLERLLSAGEGAGTPGRPDLSGAGTRDGFGVVLALPYDHLGILVRSEVDVAAAPEDIEPAAGGSATWLRARLPIGERLLNLLSLPALVSRVEETIRKGFRPGPQGAFDEES
jgi:chemotaxis signal transduction protein